MVKLASFAHLNEDLRLPLCAAVHIDRLARVVLSRQRPRAIINLVRGYVHEERLPLPLLLVLLEALQQENWHVDGPVPQQVIP